MHDCRPLRTAAFLLSNLIPFGTITDIDHDIQRIAPRATSTAP
ncbi:hypothetical protein CAter282_3730 [Collimonas arenae]|uniref:Uncharacterized protein n=1 Tax=Collimonas arenae TaxID=279058 RepID=A0A127QMY8_9BURK|nr:hypothetical protein CAter10_4077 [Collimonas arenae]AMP11411.1 hypothetical protein CAter282_3730 [Collimonas arenae]